MKTKSLILNCLLLILLSSFFYNSSAQSNQSLDSDFYLAGMNMSLLFQENDEKTLSYSSFDTLYSFPAPGPFPAGLAWDGQHLWNCDFDSLKIYKLTTTGDVVSSFPLPIGALAGGLEWDGNYLWYADEQTAILYKIDVNTTMVIQQFNLPSFGQTDPNGFGLAWDGQYLWHSDYSDSGMIYKLDPQNGQVLSSFVPPKSSILGITWANNFLYGVSIEIALSGGILYKLEPSSGVVLDSAFWEVPYPLGLVWDGNNFWNVSGNAVGGGNSRIYQISNPIAGIDNEFLIKPENITLEQNYPNPFNPSTTIKFAVPKESSVNLSIYNVLGEIVSTLVNEQKKAGYYEYKFDASNLASGVYLYRIKAGDFVETKKMVLLR